MTTFWIDNTGSLISATSDPTAAPAGAVTSTVIPPDRARYQIWNGSVWVNLINRLDLEAERSIAGGFDDAKMNRLIFEIEFDQESRLRVLEGKSVITKAQYRDALKNRWKAL